VNATVRELSRQYVFPEVAKRAGDALVAKLKAKEFDAINDGLAFAEKLSADLSALTKDLHVRYQYSAVPVPQRAADREGTGADSAAERLAAERRNFGIERVERLPGTIGCIDVRLFFAPGLAGDTIAAAIGLVAHADALIIDLRRTPGGHPGRANALNARIAELERQT
jgi:retinol-binding protein 3